MRTAHSSEVMANRAWSSQVPSISKNRSATPSMRISNFSTTRRLARLRGMIEISTRCRPRASKAKCRVMTTASGV